MAADPTQSAHPGEGRDPDRETPRVTMDPRTPTPRSGPDLGPGRRRDERFRYGALAYVTAAVVLIADQLSKFWILEVYDLPSRGQVEFLPIFSLSMVWNRGVSFGLLADQADVARWLLVVFSVLVAAGLIWWARKVDRRITALALGLIIGGAIGNAVDRARFGAVADFLDFSGLGFPWVFNIADSGITVGVILLLLEGFLPKRRPA